MAQDILGSCQRQAAIDTKPAERAQQRLQVC